MCLVFEYSYPLSNCLESTHNLEVIVSPISYWEALACCVPLCILPLCDVHRIRNHVLSDLTNFLVASCLDYCNSLFTLWLSAVTSNKTELCLELSQRHKCAHLMPVPVL